MSTPLHHTSLGELGGSNPLLTTSLGELFSETVIVSPGGDGGFDIARRSLLLSRDEEDFLQLILRAVSEIDRED